MIAAFIIVIVMILCLIWFVKVLDKPKMIEYIPHIPYVKPTLLFKNINGIDYCFRDNIYKKMFMRFVVFKKDDTNSLVQIIPYEQKHLINLPIQKVIEMINNEDANFITMIVKGGISVSTLTT